MTITKKMIALLLGLMLPLISPAAERPGLTLSAAGVAEIRQQLGTVPLFDASLAKIKAQVDAEIQAGIDTPVPRDYSGGYTHERHKRNFLILQQAGLLFQILQDEQYAIYVRDMLLQYEALYKTLPPHPKTRSYARGKLFWQCLNDANWLVYVSQAYASIFNWLSAEERSQLETNLFIPFADYISIDNPQFFNRVHNHSTWGNAAVGMIGLVMGNDELVQRALYGIEDDGLATGGMDNDGGFIKAPGQQAGFFANLDEPFSPDGYYTEGPYYQRYAMYPFLIFAQGLQNIRPELKVFEYKDGVLLKAVDALLNLTDADGEFFPLNDAQKGMSYQTSALVTAVDLAYLMGGQDPRLLSIAERQGRVLLDDAGFAVAAAIRDGKAKKFVTQSINLADGPEGDAGGVAILRAGNEALSLVFKYAAQGLSHGHYDKLSFSLYERGEEVLQDYGLVRFVNVEQKGGGNYLEENTSWAKQTIAHNTLTVNETSHFGGEYAVGSQHHSELAFFDAADAELQVVSAVERNAYPGVVMRRTMALIGNGETRKPFVLDLFKVSASEPNQYDLPFYYQGQLIDTNFDYEVPEQLTVIGKTSGLQHLYLEGKGAAAPGQSRITWLNMGKFYSLTSVTSATDELLFTRLGANDPEFNLRRDPGFMLRRRGTADTTFVTLLESHGSYSPVTELAIDSKSQVAALTLVHDADDYTAVAIEDVQGQVRLFLLANLSSPDIAHELQLNGQRFNWQGPWHLVGLHD